MKTDQLGTYDENAIPTGLVFPVKVDRMNEGISGATNRVVANFLVSRETTARMHALRRGEFMCRLMNGDIFVHEGNVYQRTFVANDGDKIDVTYERVGELVSAGVEGGDVAPETGNGNGDVEVIEISEDKFKVEKRGRAKKPDSYFIEIAKAVKGGMDGRGIRKAFGIGKNRAYQIMKQWGDKV